MVQFMNDPKEVFCERGVELHSRKDVPKLWAGYFLGIFTIVLETFRQRLSPNIASRNI